MSARTARRPGRVTRPARGDTRYRLGFLLGMCAGMSLALVLGTVAYLVMRPGTANPPTATGAPTSATAAPGSTPASGPATAAAVAVTARHLGGLKVLIEAQVNAPTTYDPITMARVVAYVDMPAMPMAHRQGPIQLAETGDRKGVYQGLATLAMVGEYDVRVEVLQPMPAVAHERVTVNTTAGGTG